MPKLIISTVGTSLLNNQIEAGFDPDLWESQLLETVNASEAEMHKHHPELIPILEDLKERAERALTIENPSDIRTVSAELNGIYGLYFNDLSQGREDAHLLIATNTFQGRIAANLLKNYLREKGISNIFIMPTDEYELTTSNNRVFSEGIAKLLPKIQETIQGYQNNHYEVYFNLVGGFRALQGFFNVIGMFYADEIIYVFEGSNELIRIPKLPIEIAPNKIEPYKVPLAMMNAGDVRTSWEDVKEVPPEWVLAVDQEMTLSTWGTLVWNQCKEFLITNELLNFPDFVYEESFKKDYGRSIITNERKIELHEKLAKIATQFMKFSGDTSRFDRSLNYTRYEGGKINHIDHFYINNKDGWRVSCIAKHGKLYLRHYGEHDYVNSNP